MIPKSLKKYSFFQLPETVVIIAFAVLIMASIMIFAQSHTWANNQDYSFGYIMPLFAIYMIYDRWDKISGYFKMPSPGPVKYSLADLAIVSIFGLMLLCGLLVYLLGTFFFGFANNKYGAPVFILSFGFCFAFFALMFFCAQRNLAGELMPVKSRLNFALLFTFPAFGWLISAPLFDTVERNVSLFLLGKVAIVVFNVMDMLGYVVELHSNVISFPNGQVGVADACSGIRSLTACLFAGSFLAAVFLNKFWKKALMVALSMLLAFFNNLLRALFLSFWAYYYGPESISGAVHDYAGYFVMGMTVIELLLLKPLFQLSAIPKEFQDKYGNYIGPEAEEGGVDESAEAQK